MFPQEMFCAVLMFYSRASAVPRHLSASASLCRSQSFPMWVSNPDPVRLPGNLGLGAGVWCPRNTSRLRRDAEDLGRVAAPGTLSLREAVSGPGLLWARTLHCVRAGRAAPRNILLNVADGSLVAPQFPAQALLRGTGRWLASCRLRPGRLLGGLGGREQGLSSARLALLAGPAREEWA